MSMKMLLAALALTVTPALAGAESGRGGEGASGDASGPYQIVTPVAPTQVAGDFDGDGDVDGRDFLIWQR